MEAGRDMQALASSASSLSKTGEPKPAGTLRAMHSTTPEGRGGREGGRRRGICELIDGIGVRSWRRKKREGEREGGREGLTMYLPRYSPSS